MMKSLHGSTKLAAFVTIFLILLLAKPSFADPQDDGMRHPGMMEDHDNLPNMYQDGQGVHLEINDIEILFMDGLPHFLFSTPEDGIMVMFTELREIDTTGGVNVITSLNLENLIFKHSDPLLIVGTQNSQNTTFTMKIYTNITLNGNSVSIEIPIKVSNVESKGMSYTIPANALKYGLIVRGWKFADPSNVLELKLRVHQSAGNAEFDSQSSTPMKQKSMTTDLHTYTTQTNIMAADFAFERYAIIDNTTKPVEIETDNSNKAFGLITIAFNSFNQSLSYDPYIFVTVDRNDNFRSRFAGYGFAMMMGVFLIFIILVMYAISRRQTPS